MGGTRAGGQRAAQSIKRSYGDDYFVQIGRRGGSAPNARPGGFARNRELASIAGRLGGSVSRRYNSRSPRTEAEVKMIERRRKEFHKAYSHLLKVHKRAKT